MKTKRNGSARPSANNTVIKAEQNRARLREFLPLLAQTVDMRRGAADVALRIVKLGLQQCAVLEDDWDLIAGTMAGALITAHACDMTRPQLASWLRSLAAEYSSTTPTKGLDS